ncbi:PilN domain-containing protein [Xenorhabdus sp. XENO-10]|uniref:PilN domain-containing protein n=1 Tax=Xenorhabdus yunnanensis TaxID=3025878 RepID=A0ABT5LH37_9GAMM|nr:PilN domain-containing protein [Xenorhabdus yunnanensis]MDC9590274.1 PilN domain-containing protein [Xenorhabdus yunnanensis]
MYQVNFLPWRQKKLKRLCQVWGTLLCLQLALWAIVLVFISTLQTNQMRQYRGQLTEITHQLAELQQSIRTTDQAVQQHHQLSQLLRKKQIFMEQNQRYLQLFRQLPHLLPENSWLTAFSDDSGQLIFTAHSQNYTDIADLLDNLTDDTSLINIQLKKMTTTEDHFKAFTIDANWSVGESDEK